MRGVLAVWVVVFHMDHNVMPVLLEIPLLRRAYLSVDAFFVLSGFMLAYTYKDKFKY
jgi:peptidoglycan/LPS O-acetylase OafA/YrhL